MPGPVVTAAIPTFNRAALLDRAVRSVLGQSFEDLRVLICDNASPDGTADVVSAFARADARVVGHRHESNRGAYYNFQFAVDRVTSPYYSILSDDDLLFPDLYRRAVSVLDRDPDLGFYASQVVLYDVVRGTHALWPARDWRPGRHEAGESVRQMTDRHFVWTGCVFRREVRDALGPIESVPMGDVLFMGRAAAAFPFFVDLRPGALFSETGSNYSRTYPVGEIARSLEVGRRWAAALPGLSAADREAVAGIVDLRLKVVAHGMLRDSLERGDFERFLEVAAYLEGRADLSRRRKAKIAAGRRGGWRFKMLGLWARLQSGFKRGRSSGWRRRSIEEIFAAYGG